MTTTFERYKGTQAGNYCTLPKIDVEILTSTPQCDYQGYGDNRSDTPCGKELTYVKQGYSGKWMHADGTTEHYSSPMPACHYCGTNEFGVVVDRKYAWHDARECSRCGGSHGFAIGD